MNNTNTVLCLEHKMNLALINVVARQDINKLS